MKEYYPTLRADGHPRSNNSHHVLAHIIIAERAIKKPLPPLAQVHHIDRDHYNNAPSNLVICENQAYHTLLHYRQHIVDLGGDPNTHKNCNHCKQIKPFLEFNKNKHTFDGLHNYCRQCRKETGY